MMAPGSIGGAASGLCVRRLLGERDRPDEVTMELDAEVALDKLATLRSLERRLPILPTGSNI